MGAWVRSGEREGSRARSTPGAGRMAVARLSHGRCGRGAAQPPSRGYGDRVRSAGDRCGRCALRRRWRRCVRAGEPPNGAGLAVRVAPIRTVRARRLVAADLEDAFDGPEEPLRESSRCPVSGSSDRWPVAPFPPSLPPRSPPAPRGTWIHGAGGLVPANHRAPVPVAQLRAPRTWDPGRRTGPGARRAVGAVGAVGPEPTRDSGAAEPTPEGCPGLARSARDYPDTARMPPCCALGEQS